ncbi:MAG: tetratricopeptide repeat protein [Ruminococcus sp.]|nr:tetratricopeptide repeat protein [Ruminococcus sp.]MBR2282994.1 tetratricopeptide repeat protein [Ruminococcus sp.]
MAKSDIIAELRGRLGNDPEENDRILREEGEKFAREGNTEGFEAVGELLVENMPEARRQEIERLTHLDGLRLDEYHDNIVKLINEHKYVDSKPLAEKLYKKITIDYAETDTAKFVSLRNPFEDNLCQLLFRQEKTLNRAPFDLAAFLTTYAYILIETGGTVEAIPVLEKAMEYNPVDVGPMFELTEIYKLLKNQKKVMEMTRKALRVASSPVAIARCYANVGYTLTDTRDYEDAAAFYTASVMFAPNPAIPFEMQHLADLKGSPIIRPTHEQMKAVMDKYDIEFGPDQDVIKVAAQLSEYYLQRKDKINALRAMKLTYNLTRDEKLKALILSLDPEALVAVPRPDGNGRPNITQTINNSAED